MWELGRNWEPPGREGALGHSPCILEPQLTGPLCFEQRKMLIYTLRGRTEKMIQIKLEWN